jgi:hypothetical protein
MWELNPNKRALRHRFSAETWLLNILSNVSPHRYQVVYTYVHMYMERQSP